MDRLAERNKPGKKPRRRLSARIADYLEAVARFPFQVVATLLKHAAQVVFAIFLLILHPGFKWLVRLLTRSRFVRDYVRPAVKTLAARFYTPYFVFLRSLPPYWATFSIGLPLVVLEPAKLYATYLITQQPESGTLLWLFLEGLSLLLIEQSWVAVRPQSRKIWLVSRLHAWGWLNFEYGKYWIRSSLFYRSMTGWKDRVWAAVKSFWRQHMAPRGRL